MKPIIDPLWFYLADVFDGINTALGTLIFVLVVLIIILTFGVCVVDGETEEKNTRKFLVKAIKKMAVGGIVATVFMVAIPNRDAMYQMMIAKTITPNNIEMVQGELKNLVDYIVDSADKLIDSKESKKE